MDGSSGGGVYHLRFNSFGRASSRPQAGDPVSAGALMVGENRLRDALLANNKLCRPGVSMQAP